jgi:uncharacterized pyridoxamine 5'-phosphate oxidase family protein
VAPHYTQKEILSFLQSQQIMSIAVINGEKPISSILAYAIDDDFSFYFITHPQSFKAIALQAHSKVGLSVWEKSKMLVQADGVASVVPPEDREVAMGKIATAMSEVDNFWPPLFRVVGSGPESREYIIFKIKPTWLRALDLSHITIKEQELPFSEYTF